MCTGTCNRNSAARHSSNTPPSAATAAAHQSESTAASAEVQALMPAVMNTVDAAITLRSLLTRKMQRSRKPRNLPAGRVRRWGAAAGWAFRMAKKCSSSSGGGGNRERSQWRRQRQHAGNSRRLPGRTATSKGRRQVG